MSDNPLSSKVGLDTTDYKAGASELNRQIRVIESGFRASAAAMGEWDKTSAGLEARQKALTSQMDLQRQKVSLLTAEYQKVAAEKGANSRAAEDLQIKINRETESLNKMQSELDQTDQALKEVGNESKNTGAKMDETAGKSGNFKSALSGLGSVIKSTVAVVAGLAVAVGGVAAAVGGLVFSSAKAADNLAEMSAKTGITVERLQELSYVGKQVGTDTDTITGSMAKLVRSMSKAGDDIYAFNQEVEKAKSSGDWPDEIEMGDTGTAFAKLRVSVLDANGDLRDSKQVFAEVIDKLGKVSNETERDAIAMQIFGKSAQELNPMIKAGSAEMARLSAEAHKVGAVMSDESVQGLADFNDTLDSLKDGLKGTLGELATAFLPGFKAMAAGAGGYLKEFGQIVRGSDGDLGKMASGLGGLLSKIVNDVATKGPEMLQAGLGIIQGLIGGIIQNLPTMIPAVISMIMTLVTFILDNIPMVLEAGLQIIIGLANGLSQALPTLIPTVVAIIPKLILMLLENLPMLIQAALSIILALAQGLVAAIPILIPEIPKIIKAVYDALILALPLIGQAAVDLTMTLITGIADNLPLIGKAAGELITVLIEGFNGLLYKITEVGGNIVNGVWQGILGKAAWLYGKVKGFFEGIVSSVRLTLEEHSPSRVFARIGENMALGLGVGFTDQFRDIERNINGAIGGLGGMSPAFASFGAGGGGAGGRVNQIDLGGIHITIQGNGNPDVVREAAGQGVMQGLRAVGLA